jgi:hypothetical protein
MTQFPLVKDSANIHTRINKKVVAEISRIAETQGVHKNAVINAVLVRGLEGLMGYGMKKGGKKKATKKTMKK